MSTTPQEHERAVADEFDRWALAGRGTSMAQGHTPLVQALLADWSLDESCRVLDVGCGVGQALVSARAHGAGPVAGIDLSPEMIASARVALPDGDFVVGTAEALPWQAAAFTHVMSIESLYYHDDPARSLAQIARVLEPGGHFATAIELYGENTGTHAWADALVCNLLIWDTEAWVDALLGAGFVDVRARRIVRQEPVLQESLFEPSRWYPTYAHYTTYLREGALHLSARRSS